jgi:glutathione S-transferase
MNTVYGIPTSPYVRKVLYSLEIKGIEYQLDPISPLEIPESFRAINPLMKIPAYVEGDLTLSESTVICEYLEDRYPEKPVYPSDPAQKAQCRWWDQYAGSAMAEAFWPLITERVINGMIYQQPVDEDIVQESLEVKIPAVLDFIESELAGRDYLIGDQLTIADVAVTAIYINAMAAGYELDAERWPSVAGHGMRVYSDPVVAKLLVMLQEAAAAQLNVDVAV